MASVQDAVDPVAAVLLLQERVNADAFLVHRGRFLDANFLLEIGDVPFIVSIERGRIVNVERGPFTMRPWDFAVRGTQLGWSRFWQRMPPPQFHDVFALMKRKELRIEGNLHTFMTHLPYLKEVLAAPRARLES